MLFPISFQNRDQRQHAQEKYLKQVQKDLNNDKLIAEALEEATWASDQDKTLDLTKSAIKSATSATLATSATDSGPISMSDLQRLLSMNSMGSVLQRLTSTSSIGSMPSSTTGLTGELGNLGLGPASIGNASMRTASDGLTASDASMRTASSGSTMSDASMRTASSNSVGLTDYEDNKKWKDEVEKMFNGKYAQTLENRKIPLYKTINGSKYAGHLYSGFIYKTVIHSGRRKGALQRNSIPDYVDWKKVGTEIIKIINELESLPTNRQYSALSESDATPYQPRAERRATVAGESQNQDIDGDRGVSELLGINHGREVGIGFGKGLRGYRRGMLQHEMFKLEGERHLGNDNKKNARELSLLKHILHNKR